MSSPIEVGYVPSRLLYAVIHYGGQVWNNTNHAFENFDGANWTDYAVTLSEQTGSSYYSATYPSQIPAGTLSTDVVYQKSGSNPSLGDSLISIGQSQGVNMLNVNGAYSGIKQFATATSTEVIAAAATGTLSTTQMTTTLTSTLTNAYQGRSVIWTSGLLINCAAAILNYNPTGGKLTFTPVPTAPSNGDTFIIV